MQILKDFWKKITAPFKIKTVHLGGARVGSLSQTLEKVCRRLATPDFWASVQ